jgi:hypothetical protein
LAKLAPLQEALYLLMAAVLAEAPEDARVLCVGAGTGAEVIELARRRAGWRFTLVEPAAAMLEAWITFRMLRTIFLKAVSEQVEFCCYTLRGHE